MPPLPPVEVLQIDREAAEVLLYGSKNVSLESVYAAFARHRQQAVAEEREAIALMCEQWRDENKSAAASARKGGDRSMGDRLDGSATECHALAGEIRKRNETRTTPGEQQS